MDERAAKTLRVGVGWPRPMFEGREAFGVATDLASAVLVLESRSVPRELSCFAVMPEECEIEVFS